MSDGDVGGVLHHIEQATVRWVDKEIATSTCEVEILENGWIHTPETGGLYPPHEVEEVMPDE